MIKPKGEPQSNEYQQCAHASHHGGFGLWQAANSLRMDFERRVGQRMGRGDVRSAILALLVDEPMHGYQIIHEIDKRSNGTWKPSAGSVYPTLQLLTDEGVVSAKEADGRKTYSLTASGKAQAEAIGQAPWLKAEGRDSSWQMVLPKSGVKLAEAVSQVARRGTPEQVDEAVTILDEARRKIYGILAKE